MADFERVAYKEALDVFGDVEIAGCLSGLGHAVGRNVVMIGLRAKYQEDWAIRVRVKSQVGPAFVPGKDIVAVFEQLQAQFTEDELELLRYFETNYCTFSL